MIEGLYKKLFATIIFRVHAWLEIFFQAKIEMSEFIVQGWEPFHKAFFQWQMTKISDKSADNQSEARISAYNKDCHLSLMTSFVKQGPDW